jgi:uncharacterized protein (UPF0179 family)
VQGASWGVQQLEYHVEEIMVALTRMLVVEVVRYRINVLSQLDLAISGQVVIL